MIDFHSTIAQKSKLVEMKSEKKGKYEVSWKKPDLQSKDSTSITNSKSFGSSKNEKSMGSIRNSKTIVSRGSLKKRVGSDEKETKLRTSMSKSSSGSGL